MDAMVKVSVPDVIKDGLDISELDDHLYKREKHRTKWWLLQQTKFDYQGDYPKIIEFCR